MARAGAAGSRTAAPHLSPSAKPDADAERDGGAAPQPSAVLRLVTRTLRVGVFYCRRHASKSFAHTSARRTTG